MDSDSELARFKWLLFGAVLFLVSGCLSWGELVYLVSGRDGEATVTKVYEARRRFRTTTYADYTFQDAEGNQRQDSAAMSDPPAVGGKLAVRYTNGKDGSSRPAGRPNWIGISLFAGSLVWIGVFGFRLFREAREETRPKARR